MTIQPISPGALDSVSSPKVQEKAAKELSANAVTLPNPLDAVTKGFDKVTEFFDVSLALIVGLVLIVLGIVILGRGAATNVAAGVVKDVAKSAKAVPKATATAAPKAVRTVKTVEERASDSIALADAKKKILAERKVADAEKARAEFLEGFQARQAAYRKERLG